MPSHIGKAIHPQNFPYLLSLILISSPQSGHFGDLIFDLVCLAQTGMPWGFMFVALPPHSAHFISKTKNEKERKQFKHSLKNSGSEWFGIQPQKTWFEKRTNSIKQHGNY